MSKEVKILTVEGMTCSHCENRIKKSLEVLNGVNKVIVDLENKKVSIDYESEKISIDTLIETIKDEGYEIK
jgi:copper chaperone